jgi:acyl-CoA thioester hydrolase
VSRASWPFSHVQRVRFGDLDAMGHLNNVEVLRFFETARIAYLQQLIPERVPARRDEFGFIFAECHVAYRSPAFFDEDIRVHVRPAELKRSSLKLEFEMRSERDGRVVAEGWGVLVGYDYENGNASPIPERVRDRLSDTLRGDA